MSTIETRKRQKVKSDNGTNMESNTKKIVTTAASAAALTAVLIYGCTVAGCANGMKPVADPQPHIDHAAEGVAKIPPLMDDNAKQTVSLLAKLPEPLQLRVQPNTSAIDLNSATAKEQAITATAALKKATEASEALSADWQRLEANRVKLEGEMEDAKQNQMKGLIALSVLAIGAGVGLMVYGLKAIGAAVAIGGGAALWASIVVAHAAGLIAIGTGVLVLAAIAYMGWKLFIERKATTELVQTGEAVKAYLTPPQRAALFGVGGVGGHADLIQSNSTQALVEEARGITGPGTVRLTPSLTANATVTPTQPNAAA